MYWKVNLCTDGQLYVSTNCQLYVMLTTLCYVDHFMLCWPLYVMLTTWCNADHFMLCWPLYVMLTTFLYRLSTLRTDSQLCVPKVNFLYCCLPYYTGWSPCCTYVNFNSLTNTYYAVYKLLKSKITLNEKYS